MKEILETGTILNDRYRVLNVLGKGGMSNVYLVEDQKLHSQWALKEMLDIYPDDEKEEILEQFRKEARILAGMKHSNLPRVFDSFEENNRHYLVMEYIEGLTLEDIFEKDPDISPRKILDWSIQLCDVLDYLHSQGIIYRDLKPGNVMVDKENRVYLVDFGIARLFSGGKIHDTIIIGTPGFASPEHHGRAETDGRSDIYSLGATLHFLLTRNDPQKIPFVFKKPSELNPKIPEKFSFAIIKAVALDPSERFQTVKEMKEFLVDKVKPVVSGEFEKAEGWNREESTPRKTSPLKRAARTVPLDQKKFCSDPIKTMTPPITISGGAVFTATIIVTGGVSLVPLLWSAAVIVPLSFLFRELMKYVNKSPAALTVNLDEDKINLVRGRININIPWEKVTGLLVFQEKSRIGTLVKRYKLFTEEGNFEYSGEMGNVEKLNDLIIQFAGLHLKGGSGDYKRYEKPSF